jgi:PAS domain S-box-containing protein
MLVSRQAGYACGHAPAARACAQGHMDMPYGMLAGGNMVPVSPRMARVSRQIGNALASSADPKALLQGMQQAIIATNLAGHVTFWNAFAEQLYGWPAEETFGVNLLDRLAPQSSHGASEEIRTAIRSGDRWSGELTVANQAGGQLNVHATFSPVHGDDGSPVGSVCVSSDASERRRTEADERLAAIVTSSEDAIVAWDRTQTVTHWNAGAERVFGYTAAEVVGDARYEIIPENRREELREMITRLWRGEAIQQLESERIRKDGRRIDVSISASPVRDSTGTVVGAAVIARDITVQRERERHLQNAKQRLRSLFTYHPDSVFAMDSEGRYTELNPACERLSGMPPDQVIGTSFGERTVERGKTREALQKALGGQPLTFEATLISRGRRRVPVQVTLVPILVNGSVQGVYGITKDISDRKRIQLQLATHARQQTAIADLGLLALTDIGTSELLRVAVELVSATLEVGTVALLEYAHETETFRLKAGVGVPERVVDGTLDTAGLRTLMAYPEPTRIDGPMLEQLFGLGYSSGGKRARGLATRLPGRETSHGIMVAWSRLPRAFADDDHRFLQQVAFVLGAAIDQHQAADELRRRESELKVLVEHSPDNIVRFDRELRFVYVNPALERMLGTSAAEMLGRSMREVGAAEPQYIDNWERALRRVFRTGEEDQMEAVYGERHYHLRLSPELGPDGLVNSVLGVGRDITSEKQREAERLNIYHELLQRDARLHELVEQVLLNQQQPVRNRLQNANILDQFSARERQILHLVARGMTNRSIGLELNLSPGTVKNYVANILPRLNATSRTHAAVLAMQLGLVSSDPPPSVS